MKWLCLFMLTIFSQIYSQNPYDEGEWSDPVPFGIVPVAVANLPDGKLLMWSSQFRETFIGEGDGATFFEIYDPFFGENGRGEGEFVANLNHDMFCPGINNLADGRILSAGGTTSSKTSIYDPSTGLWSVASEMNIPRGYQGNVTLTDGSVFTLGGSWSGGSNGGKNAEIWSAETGWINLPNVFGDDIFTQGDANSEDEGIYRLDNHAWLWAASNGKIFHAGPGSMMHWIDPTGLGTMEDAALRGVSGFMDNFSMKGTTVMFDVDKILKVGGAASYNHLHPGKSASYVIDFSDENNIAQTAVSGGTGGLALGRTMHNSTVLPNGEVLVTGGLDRAQLFTDVGARLTAELYNPGTNSFRTVATMAVPRTYHSVSILLVDGRVFVGGGGLCDGTPGCVNHFDAEIYSPPYLFNPDGSPATRPTISAPDTADYNTSISVTGSSGITDFSLVRFSAATHSTNNEQRRIPVTFSGGGGSYGVNIPDRAFLPPGYYMLFGMDANGVPSIAETIRIGNAIPLASNPNLVVDMRFDEGSGSLAADSSGFGNNGTINDVSDAGATKVANTTSWGSGLFGGALQTDGVGLQSNTIVDINYSVSLEGTNDALTIMAWVNRDEITENVSIFTHDSPKMSFGFENNLLKWEFETETGGTATCHAGYSPTGQWVHMAGSYDGEYARLYANGVEIAKKAVSGNIDFNNGGGNAGLFTTGGMYEPSANPGAGYNGSGVTGELDGRLDELKVFNVALGPEEIGTYYNTGVGAGGVDCSSPLTVEYRIGTTGTWIEGNNANVAVGDELYVRAKNAAGEYFVTTPQANGPTFSSVTDLPGQNADAAYQVDTNISGGDGLIDIDDEGLYVLTTASGCPSTLAVNVVGGCPPGATDFEVEFNINNVWCDNPASEYPCGASEITIDAGERLLLSTRLGPGQQPEFLVAITLPDGTVVYESGLFGYLDLGGVTVEDEGLYIFTSEEGCERSLQVNVTPFDCNLVQTEYNINGVWCDQPTSPIPCGESAITIDEGTDLILSITPNSQAYSIIGPNGNNKGFSFFDLTLENVTLDDAGTYLFTTGSGCEVSLELTVGAVDCSTFPLETEYNINSTAFITGETEVTVDEGDQLQLSIIPNGLSYTIAGPNGNNKDNNTLDLTLGPVTLADAGTYTFTTNNGCSVDLDVTVNDIDCTAYTLETEYSLNNTGFITGATELTVDEGDDLQLSIVPNGIPYSIVGPNGITKDFGVADLDIPVISEDNEGVYTFTTGIGCEVTLNLIVGEVDCTNVFTEYDVDDAGFVTGSQAQDLTVDEGQKLVLSIVPNSLSFSIDGPGDNDKALDPLDYTIDSISTSDEGLYTFTTGGGCEVTLNLTVTPFDCSTLGLETEYSVNGGAAVTGDDAVQILVGDAISLGIIPDGTNFSVTGPNGNDKALNGDDLAIASATTADSGTYTFTTVQGCEVTLELTVFDCTTAGVETEYSLNGGASVTGATELQIVVGDAISLGIIPDGTDFSITGPNGNDKALNGDDLVIASATTADSGTYTFTTIEGCEVTLELTVFDCSTLGLETEYSVNGGAAVTGDNAVQILVGDAISLGIIPDGTNFSVTGPNGNDKALNGDDLAIASATTADSGTYTFTTVQGCEVTLELTVFDCTTAGVETEYSLNGGASVTGATELQIVVGDAISLGIIPDGTDFSITGPNGNDKALNGDDLVIASATTADSGTYTFTTIEGCEVTLELTVFDCSTLGLETEYSVNGGAAVTGATTVEIFEGDAISLGIIPDGTNFSIAGPNSNDKALDGNDLVIATATTADSGTYTFTTEEGCETSLSLVVAGCASLGIETEYSVNGEAAVTGAGALEISEGDSVNLSIIPDGKAFSVAGPNGNDKPSNTDDLVIVAATTSDSGTYTFTTEEGCEVSLVLTVNPLDCEDLGIETEYSVNGGNSVTGASTLTVEEGDSVSLGIIPDGKTFSVAGPNGNDKASNTDDLVIASATTADSGTYTFTTEEGCQVVLVLNVNAFDCSSIGLETEYSVNNGTAVTGASTLTIEEGDSVSLGIIPDGKAFSVSGPNGNNKASDTNDLVLASATTADSGTYTFTTEEGCEVALELTVNSFDCSSIGLETEYSVNGGTAVTGASTLTIEEGDSVSLGIIPDSKAFSVSGPNGNNKASDTNDLVLASATTADSGTYTFTTEEGCEVTLELTVNGFDCSSIGLETEYSVNNGTAVTGASTLTIEEGDSVSLGIVPDGKAFSVSGPNGNNKTSNTDDLVLASATTADSGTYTFTTEEGCEVTLELTVNGFDCSSIGLETEYSVNNGTAVTGASTLTIEEGDSVSLGIVPNGKAFSVAGPNGNNKASNTDDLVIASATSADSGTYTFTTEEGCEVTLEIIVTVNQPPVANIQASVTSGDAPLEVAFDASGSTDDKNDIVSYSWDFGNGTTSDEVNPTVTFENPGVFEVTLTVTDGDGASDDESISIEAIDNTPSSLPFAVVLSPNPTSNKAKIYVDNAAGIVVSQIDIHGSGGKLISSHLPKDVFVSDGYELPISNLANGTYIISLTVNDNDRIAIRMLVRN